MFLLSLLAVVTVATAAPSLTAIGDNRGNQVWSDFGSLARYEITVFEANIPSSSWKILGHHAQGNWDSLKTPIHAFRESATAKAALAAPTNFSRIWTSDGDTTWQGGSFWRIHCPAGYVALGHIAIASDALEAAPKELYEKVRCVREGLTEPCKGFGIKVWDNSNSVARQDGSVWPVTPGKASFSEFFLAHTKIDERPSMDVACLKKSEFSVI